MKNKIKFYKAPTAIFIFLAVCLALIFGPPNYNAASGFGSLIDKHQRLDKQTNPKVVLVGGSNVALGMDSNQLEKLLNRPVVNMGFGCTVGLRYMLEEVKDAIKPGDLIVVMPEYDFFCTTTSMESNARVNGSCELLNLVQVYPGASKWVLKNYVGSPERLVGLLNDSHSLITSKLDFYKRVATRITEPGSFDHPEKIFATAPNIYNDRHAYNEHGDVTVHLNKTSPGLNGMEVINYQVYKFNPEGAQLIDEFGQFANSKGATVVVLPPPIPERVYKKFQTRADDIYQHWQKISHVKTLSRPSNFVFPETSFFDTAYHLTAAGRAERTARVAHEIESNNLASQGLSTATN